MSEQTNRYKLPYLTPSQAQKHVTHNEAIRLLDGLTNLNVKAINENTPPATPSEGDGYIIGTEPTGDWLLLASKIAVFVDGAWMTSERFQGLRAFDESTGDLMIFNSDAWQVVSTDVQETAKLGINTIPSDSVRLTVKSDALLFTTDDQQATPSGDIRVAINKTDQSNFGSLLFQTGYSGRAELGCRGNDNFSVKVSDDGTNFQSALEIDSNTGNIGMGKSPVHCLDIERNYEGQLIRSQIRNTQITSGTGAAFNVASGSHLTQFLQYSAGAAYLVSSSNSLFIQTTGNNARLRFYAGSTNSATFSADNLEFQVPAKLANFAVSQLPSPATSGVGAIVFVNDDIGGAVTAFTDGSNWLRTTDRQIVSDS